MNDPNIEEGRHPARAVSWQLSTVGKNETPCEEIEFEITDGEAKGERIVWNGWLTPAAMEFTVKALRTCGWKGDDIENIEALDSPVILVIEHEEYKGETRAKVKFINDPNYVGLGKKMAKDTATSIASRVKNHLAGVVDPPAPPVGDDDIPF
jgi:hypothetical protein